MIGMTNAMLLSLTKEHDKDREVMLLQLHEQQRTNQLLVALLESKGYAGSIPTPPQPLTVNWRGKVKGK